MVEIYGNLSPHTTERPTGMLRFVEGTVEISPKTGTIVKILQQEWQILESKPTGTTETRVWRDVPMVENEDG